MAAIAEKSFTRFAPSSQSHPLICGVQEQRERDFSFLIQQVEDHVSILENHRQQLASELHVLREYSWGLYQEYKRVLSKLEELGAEDGRFPLAGGISTLQ
ncbi:hypothetical protein N7456_006914 [Penicillium angulare]|uniref:Uncharacterized protein n=1 Tax=Penicillium angulare TaxID=116970 RepID=A0A9W9KDB9_9EURO|nr:hypothetical protein N7456_006914 [Penicillium angulare]